MSDYSPSAFRFALGASLVHYYNDFMFVYQLVIRIDYRQIGIVIHMITCVMSIKSVL